MVWIIVCMAVCPVVPFLSRGLQLNNPPDCPEHGPESFTRNIRQTGEDWGLPSAGIVNKKTNIYT